MKLGKEEKAKWCAELRSGKYAQAQCALYEAFEGEQTYCCIAVGYVALGVGACPIDELVGRADDPTNYAAKAIGLDSVVEDALVELNDKKNWPFHRIADWIEENL